MKSETDLSCKMLTANVDALRQELELLSARTKPCSPAETDRERQPQGPTILIRGK